MDCKLKTEMLRERYKAYLKPIDPLRPLGREPADLMPPPGKVIQTCFSHKEHFPRGEQLIRTLGKRTMLDRLEEYKKFQIPLQCPCEQVVQGSDPARKRKRCLGPNKPKRTKQEPQHIVCSVKNLPLAYTEMHSTLEPSPMPVRNIKRDKDLSQEAISCQRRLIRAKAVEVQNKALAQQPAKRRSCLDDAPAHRPTMPESRPSEQLPNKASVQQQPPALPVRRPPNKITANSGTMGKYPWQAFVPSKGDATCGRNSLPTLPGHPAVQLPTAPTLGARKSLVPPLGGLSKPTLHQPSLKPTNPRRPPTIASSAGNALPTYSVQPPLIPAKAAKAPPKAPPVGDSLFGITSKKTHPRRPVVPPKKQPPAPTPSPTPSTAAAAATTTLKISDSMFGITSKKTHPRRPVVPPKKQLPALVPVPAAVPVPAIADGLCGNSAKPASPKKEPTQVDGNRSMAKPATGKHFLPQQKEAVGIKNSNGPDSMPALDWFN